MGAAMGQFRIPFPGEGEHVDRLLTTAEALLAAGQLRAAYEVLVLAEHEQRSDAETARMREVVARLVATAERRAAISRLAAQRDPRLARVLPFSRRASKARPRSARASFS